MNDSTCADRKEIYGTIDQRFLGDDQFVDAIVDSTRTVITDKNKPRRHSFEQILASSRPSLGFPWKRYGQRQV